MALAVYALLAFLYFGLRPLLAPGRQYIGVFDDPQIPIWSFAWWLHAIEHLQDPLVTHLVWAPTGVNLVWANTVPAISVVFAPLTALVGPVASYDVAAVLLPALSAFTAFLLCRHLTGRFWPSLFGGYLFGFSSYELGHVLGQPQLTAVFVVPLVALVCVRALEGERRRHPPGRRARPAPRTPVLPGDGDRADPDDDARARAAPRLRARPGPPPGTRRAPLADRRCLPPRRGARRPAHLPGA